MTFCKKHMTSIIYITSLLLLVGLYTYFGAKVYAQTMSEDLASKVLRFHVLANSDTTEDQLLKENVRDAVLSYMEPKLANAADKEESKAILTENLDNITAVAEQIIANWGKDYSVYTELSFEEFPTKSYGDIVFPSGEYEACRIIIGEGAGQNWWCVMFPPLCYVDAATGVVPLEGKEELKENLTKEQYEIVAYQSEQPYQVKFKLLEWFN
ncbi:MAG: stage II sporulation protein R [Cellulosilyticaceae bacterium]